jgi:hypothetical protein
MLSYHYSTIFVHSLNNGLFQFIYSLFQQLSSIRFAIPHLLYFYDHSEEFEETKPLFDYWRNRIDFGLLPGIQVVCVVPSLSSSKFESYSNYKILKVTKSSNLESEIKRIMENLESFNGTFVLIIQIFESYKIQSNDNKF